MYDAEPMSENPLQKPKVYDLEERTFVFAKTVTSFLKNIPRSAANIEYGKQLIRSSGSVGANYIEANESLGKRDFGMKIKICRKEAKESVFWLRLLEISDATLEEERKRLVTEGKELVLIFASILRKCGAI